MRTERPGKVKRLFTPEEAADYLRQLADALDEGRVRFNEQDHELEGSVRLAVRLKEALKTRPGKTTLKVRLKFTEASMMTGDEDAPAELADEAQVDASGDSPDAAADSYKKLKKRMGKSFSRLRSGLKKGEPWQAADVEAFFADCRAMTGFPDKGDEHYESFNREAERMLAAAHAGDSEELSESIEALNRLKKECHDKYK